MQATEAPRVTPAGRIAAARWLTVVLGWRLASAWPSVKWIAEHIESGEDIPDMFLSADGNRPHLLGSVHMREVAKRILRG